MFKVGDEVVSVAKYCVTEGRNGIVLEVVEIGGMRSYTVDFYGEETPWGWSMEEKELKHVS